MEEWVKEGGGGPNDNDIELVVTQLSKRTAKQTGQVPLGDALGDALGTPYQQASPRV